MIEFLSYFAGVILVLLGAIVAVNSKWVERRKVAVVLTLAAAGLVDLWATQRAAGRGDAAIAELKVTSAELKVASSEQTRLAGLNSKLQAEILLVSKENRELSEVNRGLSTEALTIARGDPATPPYLWLSSFDIRSELPHATLYFMNPSKKYAARDVNASLRFDHATFTTEAKSVPPNSRAPAPIPNIAGLPSAKISVASLSKQGARVLFVSVIASGAGSYSQVTALIRSENKVLQAMRLYRADDPSKIVDSKSEPGFPADFKWPNLPRGAG